MSHLETNKWTPKLIIVFQLTIWSIVGIILLQKGAISLREKMKLQNDTADVQVRHFNRLLRKILYGFRDFLGGITPISN